MTETTPTAGSRPILITEIEQFGGAERSVLALARWLHQRNLPSHIVTYADHCNLAQFATHPLPVVQLRPQPEASIASQPSAATSTPSPPARPNPSPPAISPRCTPRSPACAASTP